MKVSFDFDGALSKKNVQEYCSKLIRNGHEVWIVTSRTKEFNGAIHYHDDLMLVAKELGISEDRIHFTNAEDKAPFLFLNKFDIHLDDDLHELIQIFETSVTGMNVRNNLWRTYIDQFLGEKND